MAEVKYPELDSGDALLPLIQHLEGSGDDAVSPAGAIGRYQITPDTAKRYGFDPSRLTDPSYNETVARVILNDLHEKFKGDVPSILIGYNAGPGVAKRYQDQSNRDYLPQETQKYLTKADTWLGKNKLPAPGLTNIAATGDEIQPSDEDWKAHFTAIAGGGDAASADTPSDEDWAKHFSQLAGTPTPTVGAAPPQMPNGAKRSLAIGANALASGFSDVAGFPGTVQEGLGKYLPKSQVQSLIEQGIDPLTTTTNPKDWKTFAEEGQTPPSPGGHLPNPLEIEQKTGLGLSVRPDIVPTGVMERYGAALAEGIPNALMLGPEKLASWGVAGAQSLAAQGARDEAPSMPWLAPVAGVLAGLTVHGGTDWLEQSAAGAGAAARLMKAQYDLMKAKGAKIGSTGAASIRAIADQKLQATKDLAQASLDSSSKYVQETFSKVRDALGTSETHQDLGQVFQSEGRNWLEKIFPKKLATVEAPLSSAMAGKPVEPEAFARVLDSLTSKGGSLKGFVDSLTPPLARRFQSMLTARGKLGELLDIPVADAGAATKAAGEAVPKAPPAPTPPPSWEDVRDLRTALGKTKADPKLLKDMSAEQANALYAALTEDLGTAAKKAGAGDLWTNYNDEATRLYSFRDNVVSKLVGAKNEAKETLVPGKIAKSLMNEAKLDGTTAAQLRAEMPKAADEMAAFSLQSPETWQKLSPEAREALVPHPEHAAALRKALTGHEETQANAQTEIAKAEAARKADITSAALEREKLGKNALSAKMLADQARDVVSPVPDITKAVQSLVNVIKGTGQSGFGYLLAKEIAPAVMSLSHTPTHPIIQSALTAAGLGLPMIVRGVQRIAKNPGSLRVPATGVIAGENALAMPSPQANRERGK